MSETVSPTAGRAYGLARVARGWHLSRAMVYDHRDGADYEASPVPKGRSGRALLRRRLVEYISAQILGSRLHGEGYRKIWARLRFSGVRSSARRVRHFMGQQATRAAPDRPSRAARPWRHHHHHRRGRAVGYRHDRDRDPRGGRAQVSLPSTTATASASATMPTGPAIASRRSNRSARACAGTSAASERTRPWVSNSATTTAPTTCPATSRTRSPSLGIEGSPSFVRQPEGNGVAERFIRTLKENFLL